MILPFKSSNIVDRQINPVEQNVKVGRITEFMKMKMEVEVEKLEGVVVYLVPVFLICFIVLIVYIIIG